MNADACPPVTTTCHRHGHVHRRASTLEHLPQLGGAPVAEGGTLTTRHDGGHPSPLTAQTGVSNRIHTSEDAVESSGRNPARYCALIEADRAELLDRGDPMLRGGDPSHRGIPAILDAFVSHTETKASRRGIRPRGGLLPYPAKSHARVIVTAPKLAGMLYDRAKIYVEGGRGGDGCISFRREAHVPRGGPDGGDGGRGGDVILVCDPSRRDLAWLQRARHFRAGRGGHGQGKQRHGARGADKELLVPPGTQVSGLEGRVYDLVEAGQRAVVAAGGLGGHGNKRFATSTRQTPRFAERGLEGEAGWIELRLKVLADAGLVGQPNAGKSSLLRRLTRATPKVAEYPFTTLEPALGTVDSDERQLVLADIPGLIEGAAQGAGLGHEFLAHVERCRVLVHLVDLGGEDPLAAYDSVRSELVEYGTGLEQLPELVMLSKRDLFPDAQPAAAVP